jgi:hypothetical protein
VDFSSARGEDHAKLGSVARRRSRVCPSRGIFFCFSVSAVCGCAAAAMVQGGAVIDAVCDMREGVSLRRV